MFTHGLGHCSCYLGNRLHEDRQSSAFVHFCFLPKQGRISRI